MLNYAISYKSHHFVSEKSRFDFKKRYWGLTKAFVCIAYEAIEPYPMLCFMPAVRRVRLLAKLSCTAKQQVQQLSDVHLSPTQGAEHSMRRFI